MTNLEIANTIRQQIIAQDKWALGAWGAKKLMVVGKGLTFRVSTPSFKGFVQISLEPNDTYRVERFKPYRLERRSVKVMDNVYWDSLVQVIDSLVEGR